MKKILFRIARSNISVMFIGICFKYFSYLVPFKKIYKDKWVISFFHPVKFWNIHILIIPKEIIKTFLSLNLKNKNHYRSIISIFKAVAYVTNILKLDNYGVTVNGGEYQDVPHLHFHLFSPNSNQDKYVLSANDILFENKNFSLSNYQDSTKKIHLVLNINHFSGSPNFDITSFRSSTVLLICKVSKSVCTKTEFSFFISFKNLSSS